MIEKNPKISVLRKMIGISEESEPHFIVPQNSLTHIRHRMGLCERNSPCAATPNAVHALMAPSLLSGAFVKTGSKASGLGCPHCENMAKNFLYLESLIRSNYDARYSCSLCYSALKYLQYVNKSIMEVFSNSQTILEAAKTFSKPCKQPFRLPKQRSRNSKLHSRSTLIATTNLSTGLLVKRKSRVMDASKIALKLPLKHKSIKNISHVSLSGAMKKKPLAKSHSGHRKPKSLTKQSSKVRPSANASGKVVKRSKEIKTRIPVRIHKRKPTASASKIRSIPH